ncbi:MAG: terminase large subunit domain-containing protein [Ferrovibrionaceae bacterium]
MTGPAVPLYGYQKRWLLDRRPFKIGMFSRQSGKTFTTTLEIVDSCFEAWARGQRERWVILSRGERQAKEAMDEGIKRHAAAYGLGFEENGYDFACEGEEIKVKALEVELPGGSRITALPANPDTARGFSANMFLDEFAIHKNSRDIWAACFPIVSKAGLRLRVTSTPKGKGNKFYDIMSGGDDVWSRHKVTIYDAVADGLDRDIEALRAGLGDDDIWRQEYLCEWLDEASSWLSYEMISAAEDPDAGKPELYQGGPCYVGVDIARRQDLFVVWVWEKVGDVLWCREIIERQRITFAEQDELFDDVMRRYRVARSCWDQTGMGEKPVEDAQRRHGVYRIEGVLLNGARRLHVATVGKQHFEDRKVRIPAGRPVLRSDLHKLKMVASETGAPRLAADRDGDGHADRTWACFLGVAAVENGPARYAYETAAGARRGYAGAADARGGNYFETDDAELASRSRNFGAF